MRMPPDLWRDCFYLNRRGNKRLVIAFSHYDPYRRQRDTFSFHRLTQRKDIDTLLVRDGQKGTTWFFYPQGFDKGLAPHMAMIETIQKVAADYDEVLFLGNSMAAWGALYFGRLVPGAIIAAFGHSLTLEEDFNTQYRPEVLPCIRELYDNIKDRDKLTLVNKQWDLPKKIIFYEEISYNDKFKDVFAKGNFIEYKLIGTGHNLLYAFYKMGPFDKLLDSFFEGPPNGIGLDFGAEVEIMRQKYAYSIQREGNVFHFEFGNEEAILAADADVAFFISQNGQLVHQSYHALTEEHIRQRRAVFDLPFPKGDYTIAAHLGINKLAVSELGLPSYHEFVPAGGGAAGAGLMAPAAKLHNPRAPTAHLPPSAKG